MKKTNMERNVILPNDKSEIIHFYQYLPGLMPGNGELLMRNPTVETTVHYFKSLVSLTVL